MDIRDGFIGTVGNTPLIKLRRASEETGCTILGKAEGLDCSVGTGGTMSGVGNALKQRHSDVKIYLSEWMGSGIYNRYASDEWKPEGNSITEGNGNNHETGNLEGFAPDVQYQITD